jgi:hypothetical protein
MTEKPPTPPAPRGLAAKLGWPVAANKDAELPRVLAVPGPKDGDARISHEPVVGVDAEELIARVSTVPAEPEGEKSK